MRAAIVNAPRSATVTILSLGGVVGIVAGLWPPGVLPLAGLLIALLTVCWYPAAGLALLLLSRSSMDALTGAQILPPTSRDSRPPEAA